jgi:hypothetical protein
MRSVDCLFERVSSVGVGLALLFMALVFSVITITALPVFGFVIAAPVFLLAVWFFFSPRSRECTLR